jgi:hypothetical protein
VANDLPIRAVSHAHAWARGGPTHRSAYRKSPGLEAPACTGGLYWVSSILVPGQWDKASLFQCTGCKRLLTLYCGEVLADFPIPIINAEASPVP